MAATFKQTTILFVVLAFLRSYTASAQEGSRRDNQPVRNDQEKPSERLDQVERRNQPPKTIREMIAWELAHNSETDRKPEVYTGRDGLRVFGRDQNPVRHSERLREQPTVAPRTAAPTPPKPPDYQFLDTDGESETSILLRKIQKTLDEERLYREIRLKSYQLQEEENVRTQTNKDAKEAQERQQKLKQKMQQPNRRPFRWKREVKIHPQLKPEVVMQPRMEMPMEKETEEKYQEKLSKTREKRQVLYLIGGRTPQLLRPPRTTPNPFIRQTNIEDYEIVRPRLGDEFRQAPGNDADGESSVEDSSYQLSEIRNALSEINKKSLSLQINQLATRNGGTRIKRSPKMSKLKKKQKLAKKKRKKKKQQKLSPRQIKHYRRIREHKEERRKILHKKLKEKRRLRHKKMGTGPYNKTIIDYYGVYFDPPSSQINDSLYDSIYDSSAIDSEKMYEEAMKDYPDSGVEGGEYEDSEEEEEEDDEVEDDENGEQDGEKGGGTNTGNKSEGNKNEKEKSENKSKMNKHSNAKKNTQTMKHPLRAQTGKEKNDRNNKLSKNLNYQRTKEGIRKLEKNQIKFKTKILTNKNDHNANIKTKNNKRTILNEIPSVIGDTSSMINSDLINVIFDNEQKVTGHDFSETLNPIFTSKDFKQTLKTEKFKTIIPIPQSNGYRILQI